MKVRIATRKSALALWQTEHVAELVRGLPEVSAIEIVPMSTRGDEILDRSLQKIGGKGLFIKELEVAMATDRADIAVHSMKDVPAEMPEGFMLAAVLERANPFDGLVSSKATSLMSLPDGARVGSSSLRRQAQLLALRPDVSVEPLRGNVNTRLAKLDAGNFDAILLACAGLERLGMSDRIAAQIGPDQMMPAAAQGVIGIECLADRDDLSQLLARLEDPVTKSTTLAERAVARRLGVAPRQAARLHRSEHQVLQHREMRKQIELLEHHADLGADRLDRGLVVAQTPCRRRGSRRFDAPRAG